MCGISAIVDPEGVVAPDVIARMTNRLGHRGPDARHWRSTAPFHVGHTRLSIIDLGSGHQPMDDVTGRYCITFNGELYNYRELRADLLALGRRFATQSDTEVI